MTATKPRRLTPSGNCRSNTCQRAIRPRHWSTGDKALELYPNDLDIIVSQISVAQALKDSGKVVDYAVRGAAIFDSIATQPKPADVSEEDWKTRVAEEQDSARSSYDYVESAAYNAIAGEQDPGKRMSEIEKFTPAFPKSKFDDQISQLALYSLQQLNQPQRLEAYGEKALAANPESVPTLLMMANAYSEDPKQASKAITYANKVIALTETSTDPKKKLAAGVAHSTHRLCLSEAGQAHSCRRGVEDRCRACCRAIRRQSRRRCSAWAMPMRSRIAGPTRWRPCRRPRPSTVRIRRRRKRCWRR